MRVDFHGISTGGDGVGRDEFNRIVFAPYAAPGDIAEVAIEQEHRSFAHGRILNLISSSPQRTLPPCEYFVPDESNDALTACGGCQLQHLSYQAQLEAKTSIVRDTLQRIAGIDEPNVTPCVPSPLPFNYRNKADFVVTQDADGARIGFFARNSHHTIDVAHCPIQQEPNNALLAAVRDCINAGLAPPSDPSSGKGVLRRLVARTASNGETLITAVTTSAPWAGATEFAERLRAAVPSLVGVLRREPQQQAQIIVGRDWLEENVMGLRLRVGGDAFFQINTSLTPTLVETALRMAEIEQGQRALDLFCGVGLFALSMARHGARVRGIESNRPAVRNAVLNARQNGLTAEFRAGDAARELRGLTAGEWDIVVLDPPRAGAKECMGELARLHPRRIVYVSCDPATLARDIKALSPYGYCLSEAIPVDLFPQTAHVEVVAKLEKIT